MSKDHKSMMGWSSVKIANGCGKREGAWGRGIVSWDNNFEMNSQ